MRLVYKFITNQHKADVFELCRASKDLYNQALYLIKTTLDTDGNFLFYNEVERIMKVTTNLEGTINYKRLKAQVAQQTLKVLDKSISSYISSIKDWSKHKDKYNGKPELPRYMRKNGYRQLIYTNQACTIKDGFIHLSKSLKISIPQWDKYKDDLINYQQVRINPLANMNYEVEIVYLTDDIGLNGYEGVASIDLGVGNFATMVSSEFQPIIYNGKQIKSLNQYFNKTISQEKSELEKVNGYKSSKKIRKLWQKRNHTITDAFHKVSRHIVNLCLNHKIGTLIVGYNSGWKDSINMGRQNNQTFVMIPYLKFIQCLQYKCLMSGINLIINEESYTSKCDSLALETIEKHETYLGKRVKRGLFQSSKGKTINADVNGALNIMRKVIGDSEIISKIIDSGWLFQPSKLNDLYHLGL